jgi:putative nucleotidyltransferase with HDIG domain
MRLATRTFLWTFLPAAVLLTASFWMVERQVTSAMRSEVRKSLRDQQTMLAGMSIKNEENGRRALAVLSENPALRAGMSLMQTQVYRQDARLTLEDQLLEVGRESSFDLLFVFDGAGRPVAGVLREEGRLVVLPENEAPELEAGIITARGRIFQMVTATVEQSGEILGQLSAGDEFLASESGMPEVLERGGKVVRSSVTGVSRDALESFLRTCGGASECEGSLGGESYVAMSMGGMAQDSGYTLHSLRSVDEASRPIQAHLRGMFLWAAAGGLVLAVVMCTLASLSLARPIERLVDHLRRCEAQGDLREFQADGRAAGEVLALTETFSRVAAAARQSSLHLRQAYVEFVQLLASALDARDAYTAGHSARVSQYSCAIARVLAAPEEEVETTRIGALLHDIGKIGIADAVLQKPGKLTAVEFDLLKQHPSIGRRILEGVQEFERYLPVVELHHENWDGSGYPHGQRAEETPRPARIVHVADAYDAMTSNRPYRKGMEMSEAIAELQRWSGKQFDRRIVEVFVGLLRSCPTPPDSGDGELGASLLRLAEALESHQVSEAAGRMV